MLPFNILVVSRCSEKCSSLYVVADIREHVHSYVGYCHTRKWLWLHIAYHCTTSGFGRHCVCLL